MATATTTMLRPGGAHARQAGSAAADRVGLVSAIRSEFTKIRSVRST
ncbi:MAG TPA: hypothetical protein VFW16_12185 [Streptosporangiaceae bacterium]|nr:hypothetical protein [Streptosporangiaceae bacterium]